MLIEPATVAQRAEKLRALKSPQNTKNKAKKKGKQIVSQRGENAFEKRSQEISRW